MTQRSRPFVETFGALRGFRILTGQHVSDLLKKITPLIDDMSRAKERGWRRAAVRALSAEFAPGNPIYNNIGDNVVFALAANLLNFYEFGTCSDVAQMFSKEWLSDSNWCHPGLESEIGYPLEGEHGAALSLSEFIWADVGAGLLYSQTLAESVHKNEVETSGRVRDNHIRVFIEPYSVEMHVEGGDSIIVHLPVVFVMINKKMLSDHSSLSNRALLRFMRFLGEFCKCFATTETHTVKLPAPASVAESKAFAADTSAELTYLFNAKRNWKSGDDNAYHTWHVVEYDITKRNIDECVAWG